MSATDAKPPNPPPPSPATCTNAHLIADERFIAQLGQIKKLKQFLFEERVNFELDRLQLIDLANLNNLRFSQKGREPTLEEWRLLDEKLSHLASYLNDDLRRKKRIQDLSFFFGQMPIYFLIAAALSTIFIFLYPYFLSSGSAAFAASYLFGLVIWTLAQGGLGACAFLGTRVSISKLKGDTAGQVDLVDITDRRVLQSRVLLGALFGFLFGLPLANMAMQEVNNALFKEDYTLNVSSLSVIFIPFLVGFSTNLVLTILDRFVAAIRSLFGISTSEV